MVVSAPIGQNPSVNGRVQGFDSPIQCLGKSGDLGHVRHRDTRVTNGLRGGAGGDNLKAARGQLGSEVGHSGLVADGNQRPPGVHDLVLTSVGGEVCAPPRTIRRPHPTTTAFLSV